MNESESNSNEWTYTHALDSVFFLHKYPPLQTKTAAPKQSSSAALFKHYCSVGAVQMMSFPPAAGWLSFSLSLAPSTQNAAHVLSCRLGGRGKGRRDQIALQRGCDIINALLHLQQPGDDQSDASRLARQQNAWELCFKPENVEGYRFKTDRPNSCLLTQWWRICLEEKDEARLFTFAVFRWIYKVNSR